MSYQKITICGIVGKTAEVKSFNGKDFITFSVAVLNGKDAQGNNRPTTWFDVTKDFNRQTQGWLAERLVAKSQVLVDGRVSTNAFIDRNGQAQANLKIYANTIEPLGTQSKETQSSSVAPSYAPSGDYNAPF